MKTIILNEPGGTEKLIYVQTDVPNLSEGEILVKVAAIGLNPVDYKARSSAGTLSNFFGQQRPAILGWDISGTVVGSESSDFNVGDDVFGMVNFPGQGKAYAEYVAVPASHLTLKPSDISHVEAAAATLAALTSWQALLTNAHIKAGDRVLVHAASGGVGHYATQIAHHFGAHVIGTSSAINREFVVKNGADQHIDYQSQAYENILTDIDVVLDTIGGSNIPKSINVTKPGGQVISIVTHNLPEEYLQLAKTKNVHLTSMLVKSSGTDMQQIARLLKDKSLKSHVSAVYHFEEMHLAHQQLETGRTVGKIVVVI